MGFSKPPSWRTDHARAPWTSQAKTNDLNKRKEIKWDATCWALGRHVPAARGRGAGSGGPRRRHEQGEDATAVLRAAGINGGRRRPRLSRKATRRDPPAQYVYICVRRRQRRRQLGCLPDGCGTACPQGSGMQWTSPLLLIFHASGCVAMRWLEVGAVGRSGEGGGGAGLNEHVREMMDRRRLADG